MSVNLMVTLWPSFPHFGQFAHDPRLSGIRLNSAMISNPELEKELEMVAAMQPPVPLYFDAKGRQLRVTEAIPYEDHLEVVLNHPISVVTPTPVLFKAGVDNALLIEVADDGRRLVFQGGPEYLVKPGESLHIRHPSLQVSGPTFTDEEKRKIEQVVKAGFTRYYLSYVQQQQDVDEFLELVGADSEVMLKIEDKAGLGYVASCFQKRDNLTLVAARGDLFVEVDRPHHILDALKLIIEKDPKACVGSRILLSVIHEPVPSCADLIELAWLYDIGYRTMLLCDELCLKGDLLEIAVDVFDNFRQTYAGS